MAFAAAPIFLLMGSIAYLQHPPLCTAPGGLGFLSSMWLMYGVMAFVHAGPWFVLARRSFKGAAFEKRRQTRDNHSRPPKT